MKNKFCFFLTVAVFATLGSDFIYTMNITCDEPPRIFGYTFKPWEKSDNYINGPSKIIKYERPEDFFGKCYDFTVKMSLDITQDHKKLPTSRSNDIITHLDFLNKYCQQVESPAEGDIAVHCNATTCEINHFALVVDPYPDKKTQKCIVASKLGSIPNVYQYNIFDSRVGPYRIDYGKRVSFHRRKDEFLDNEKLLACLQKDIAQSPSIAKTISQNNVLLLILAEGKKVRLHKLGNLNTASGYDQTSSLLKSCMGLDINTCTADGNTPLMLATARQDTPMMKLLLTMGADETLRNKKELTAFDIAQDNFTYEQKKGSGITTGEWLKHQATMNLLR